jgi:putative tricarboxylic transport membrane protein
MAVFLGILVLHGLQPGPILLTQNQTEIYGLVWALTASCILASMVGLLLVKPLARITLIDSRILVPIVTSVAMVGSYAIDNTIENVLVTAIFGIIGYLMIRYDYPRLTVVVALVLGGTAERNFQQSLMIGDGHWSIFVERPVSAILLAITVIMLVWPMIRARPRRRLQPVRP